MKNRTWFMLVAVFFSVCGLNAFAYSGGSGTESDPYLISTKEDLLGLGADTGNYDKCFRLTTDIDLSGTNFSEAVIAAGLSFPFSGCFDGNGNIVENLDINGVSNFVGLFGYLTSGSLVCNVGVSGNVEGRNCVGGLVGYNSSGIISNCYSLVSVSGVDYVGGVCGDNWSTLVCCYSKGSVSGNKYVGGLVGENYEGYIGYCYSTGKVQGDNYTGGFCGFNELGCVTSCFWNVESSGMSTSCGGIGKTTAIMQMKSTFIDAGWDFDNVWKMRSYPILKWQPFGGGFGTELDPYLISTKEDLFQLGTNTGNYDKCFRLTTDIDLSGTNFADSVIAVCEETCFTGIFDGDGHKISNLSITSTNDYVGLVGCLYSGGTISRLGITGGVEGNNYVGGLVGYNNSGIISNCYSTVSVSGVDYVGGLCGGTWSTIVCCYSTGRIDGNDSVGGLCGNISLGIVSNCYSIGLVVGNDSVGGFCGNNFFGKVFSCFWDFETSGLSTSDGGTGKTTVEMQTQSTFTDAGWDFEKIWYMNDYPALICGYRYSGGSGTESDPYLIANKADLLELREKNADYDKCFRLTTSIDLSGESFASAVIAPDVDPETLYYQGTEFSGCFNGDGHKISNLNITGTNDYAGLFGWHSGEVYDLWISGRVVGRNNSGGVAGLNSGLILECCSQVSVSGNEYVGSLCGVNSFKITSCLASGNVDGNYYVGGFCGGNYFGEVYCSYSTGRVLGELDPGGFCGVNYYGSVVSCFWDVETSGLSTSDGGTGKTTVEMQTQSTFTDAGWDFDDVWKMNIYPLLKWQLFSGGSGTESDPYLISTKKDLLGLGTYTNYYGSCFKQIADIDLSGESFASAVIAPDVDPETLYYQGTEFSGCFNGDGHKISNLNITGTNDYAGLFGYLTSGSLVCNVGVSGNVKGNNYVGGLVGYNFSGTISNCCSSVSVSGNDYVGGLIGYNTYVDVINCCINCYATGSVSGRVDVGGLVGYSSNGDDINCYATGRVSGEHSVGGLVGHQFQGDDINCYATGSVSGKDNAGGLVGYYSNGDVINCYATGRVSGTEDVGGLLGFIDRGDVSYSYSTGLVVGNNSVGGFCGDIFYSSVVSCFWDVESSGTTNSFRGTGKTTAEMQTQSTFTDAGWNFDAVWFMGDYPIFQWQNPIYCDWVNNYDVPVDEQGYSDCPADDGIQNLLKYAIGLDPMSECCCADVMVPATETNEFGIVYHLSKSAEDVELYPTWSPSLISNIWYTSGFEFSMVSETSSNETWKATIPTTNDCGYIKLNAKQ